MQDLNFSLRAMRNMKPDRAILEWVDAWPQRARLGQRPQLEDVVLQLVEQILRFAVAEEVNTPFAERRTITVRVVITVEQIDVIPALLTPRRQQRVGMLVQYIGIDHCRGATLTLLTLVLVTQKVLVRDDISPVVSARVEYTQQHLTETR